MSVESRRRQFRVRHADAIKEKRQQWQKENQHKRIAHNKVNSALRSGKLVRPTKCDSCHLESRFIDAHHHDYSAPLEVHWLCRKCHSAEHGKIPRGKTILRGDKVGNATKTNKEIKITKKLIELGVATKIISLALDMPTGMILKIKRGEIWKSV